MPRGAKPNPETKRTDRRRHPMVSAAPGGWDGPIPDPPEDISPSAQAIWASWFHGWWASFWSEDDVPQLRELLVLWTTALKSGKGLPQAVALLDRYGITPKGRQDLRWDKPVEAKAEEPVVNDELAAQRAQRRASIA